jgi:hypothetical protein
MFIKWLKPIKLSLILDFKKYSNINYGKTNCFK